MITQTSYEHNNIPTPSVLLLHPSIPLLSTASCFHAIITIVLPLLGWHIYCILFLQFLIWHCYLNIIIFIVTLVYYVQGLVPDAEEQLELIAMNAQLLKSVPAKDDLFYIDQNQRPGMTSTLHTYIHTCMHSYRHTHIYVVHIVNSRQYVMPST